MTETRPVDSIVVSKRYRDDLGDITGLAASITALGLLHPIVIDPDDVLIAGGRRLIACRELGWAEVPVHVVDNLADAADRLAAERDENTERKPMTPSELVALAKAIEAIEAPKAAERQQAGRQRGADVTAGRLPASAGAKPSVQTRDVVAGAVGIGRTNLSNAKKIIEAAEAGDPRAIEAKEQMDRTGQIQPAYEYMIGKRISHPERGAPAALRKRPVKNYPGRAPVRAMEGAVSTLSGLTGPMRDLSAADFADLDADTRARWTRDLTDAMAAIRRVRDLIKGEN